MNEVMEQRGIRWLSEAVPFDFAQGTGLGILLKISSLQRSGNGTRHSVENKLIATLRVQIESSVTLCSSIANALDFSSTFYPSLVLCCHNCS